MTHASRSAAAWAAPGKAGLAGGIVMHALLGWTAVWLPAAVSGASRAWAWSAASALILACLRLAGAHWPVARAASKSLARCAVALCAAASVDFSVHSPEHVLSLCSAAASWNAQFQLVAAHLATLPFSSAAMAGLVLCESAGRHGRVRPLRAALSLGAMVAAMLVAMWALPWLARSLQWPWTADALVFSMIFSMLLFDLLHLQPKWRKRECPYREFPA